MCSAASRPAAASPAPSPAASQSGLVLTVWTRGFVQNQVLGDVAIDTNVLLFVVAAAVATALAFGLGPALSVTRAAVRRAPQAGRRGPFGSRTPFGPCRAAGGGETAPASCRRWPGVGEAALRRKDVRMNGGHCPLRIATCRRHPGL